MKNLIVLLFILSFVACSGGRNNTGYSVINDMKYAVAYEAFTDNPVLPNGQTMMPPVEGTISRGFLPDEVDVDGNPVLLENPFEMNERTWARGEHLYNVMCASCHAVDGNGQGLVVTEGGFPRPPSFTERRWRSIERFPVGHVYRVVTHGIGNMAAYSQQLDAEDRWAVSEYVRHYLMRGGDRYNQ